MANERIAPVDEIELLRAAACDWKNSRGDVAVLAVILQHCDAEWRSFPGPSRIAKTARLSVTSVKASLKRLEARRYIEVERPGLRRANRFRVLKSPHVTSLKTAIDMAELGNRAPPVSRASSVATRQAQRSPTGEAGTHQLGKPARQEVALKAPNRKHLCVDDEQQQRHQSEEQERQAQEEHKAKQRETVRAEYLQTRDTHPKHARMMERLFPKDLEDLIESSA